MFLICVVFFFVVVKVFVTVADRAKSSTSTNPEIVYPQLLTYMLVELDRKARAIRARLEGVGG